MAPVPPRRRSPSAASCGDVQPRKLPKRAAGAGLRSGEEEDDDGLALIDEALLLVFSRASGDTADLVRCASTCRRWRRLVTQDAAFICHQAPRRRRSDDDRLLRFVHPNEVDTASRVPWFLRLCQPALAGSGLVVGNGRWASAAASCRVVASSRDGRLVAEIRGATTATSNSAANLCVCNPVTGEADVLPPMGAGGDADDSPWPYACALLKVRRSAAAYRLVVIYNRPGYTAARCFSSVTGSWGREARVTGARVCGTLLRGAHAIVRRGVVFWPRLAFALLSLPTAGKAVVEGASAPLRYAWRRSLLRLTPYGRLCFVKHAGDGGINVSFRSHDTGDMFRVRDGALKLNGHWSPGRRVSLRRLMPHVPPGGVALRGFCETSSAVFFTARMDLEECCFILDVDTMEAKRLPSTTIGGEVSSDMYGYEMDLAAYLGTL